MLQQQWHRLMEVQRRQFRVMGELTDTCAKTGARPDMALEPTSCCKTNFSVIRNEVKDLELVEKTRCFAPLRMTRSRGLEFCYSF
jgi:hypothetical protein